MKIQLGNGKNKRDNSLALLHGEAASSAVENAGCAYQSPSIIAAGANAQGVALLSTFTHLVLSILLIKVPSLVEGKQNRLKRTTLIIAVISAITWLPIVFVILFMKNVNPLLLTALWIIGLVPTTLLYPIRDNWLAGLVPSEKMGRYLSWRAVISGVCYLASFYLMGFILEKSIGFESRSYAFILSLAFLASAVSVVIFCGVRPLTVTSSVNTPQLSFLNFLKDTRKNHLGTFILFVSLYTFAVNLSGPFIAPYMINNLQFSPITYTLVISIEFVARIISLTFWGKLMDKSGSLKILSQVSYLIPFVPVLWLFSTNYIYFCGVQLLSGTVWAAFDLSVQTFIYKATAPEQRLRYIVYYRSLTSFSVALGAITGALLLNNMFSIFGSSILGMFLLSGVLRLIIARVMLPKLTLQGIPEAVIHPELAAELATVPNIARAGLYYYPDLWKRVTRVASAGGKVVGKAFSTFGISKDGLFYKPAKWSEYISNAGIRQTDTDDVKIQNNLFHNPGKWSEYLNGIGVQPVQTEARIQPVRDGLYYHKEGWIKFQEDLLANTPNKSLPEPERKGLFHNPQNWGEYIKKSMVLNATTMQTAGEGPVMRQPVYYHPEIWNKYQSETNKKLSNTPEMAARKGLLYHPDAWQRHNVNSKIQKRQNLFSPQGVTTVGRFRANTYKQQAAA
jgi:MFS family permease